MITPKMKSCRPQILVLLLAGLIAPPVTAEVIPGRWEKVSAMEMALPITVELKNGNRIQGQFRGLSPSDLELLSPAGWATIPRTDIRTITAPSKDGLGNGAKIGAGIGAGIVVGAVGIAAMAQNKGDAASAPMLMLILGGGAAGIGAGLGMIADAAIKTEDIVLYIAPGTPRRSKHKDSEWWPPDPPEDEPEKPKISK